MDAAGWLLPHSVADTLNTTCPVLTLGLEVWGLDAAGWLLPHSVADTLGPILRLTLIRVAEQHSAETAPTVDGACSANCDTELEKL